jgi:hypothetical protein
MPEILVTREFGMWPDRWRAAGPGCQGFYAMTKKRAIKKAAKAWAGAYEERVQVGPSDTEAALARAVRRYVDGEITIEQLERLVR